MSTRRERLVGARKAAGFTQDRLAAALGVYRSTVVRWEAGETEPPPYLRPKLARLLGVSGAELTALLAASRPGHLPVPSAPPNTEPADAPLQMLGERPEGLTPVPPPASRAWRPRSQAVPAGQLDVVLAHLREQWHLLVRTDNVLGPRYALRAVLDHLATIEGLLTSVGVAARREAAKLGAQYAESASWLYEDSGALSTANAWNNRAMEWAHEAGDDLMIAWTLFRRSQQAVPTGNAAHVISLAHAATRAHPELPPPMRAAIAQQEAHGYALDGDERATQATLDDAQGWAATDTAGDARGGHGSFCTASYIQLQRAYCWLTLGRPQRAIQLYETTMPQIPAVYRRDRGVALGRLASAYVAVNEPEQAASVATEALHIAESAGSTRALRGVRQVGQRLAGHRRLPDVALLLDALATGGSF